jgi:alanyl-tRNA synthetase
LTRAWTAVRAGRDDERGERQHQRRTDPLPHPRRSVEGCTSARRATESHLVTELLYLRDAYLREFEATVVACRDSAIALDRTAFYPTGGGQPNDTGTLAGLPVTDVR